jgi:hypothetical protein
MCQCELALAFPRKSSHSSWMHIRLKLLNTVFFLFSFIRLYATDFALWVFMCTIFKEELIMYR